MERFKLITSIYLFLIRDGKILLMKRKNTNYWDNYYGPPAGHLEDNESITEGLKREVKEEIGLDINTKDLKLVHTMHRKEKDIRVDFFFIVKSYRGTPKNTEPEKCSEIKWFDLNKLPKNTIPYIRKAVNNYKKNIIYSELGWKK